jgi:hypothetical protein
MTIDPKETVAGCSLLRIRAFVRRYSNDEFDLPLVARALDETKAVEILAWLKANKYIQPVRGRKGYWTGTDHAGALANASAGKKITRATADRLLQELLQRAARVNREREFAYYVDRIMVWGSYLGTANTMGDLDVAVKLMPVKEDLPSQQRVEYERLRAASAGGHRYRNLVEQLYWPQEEVFRFLKGRARSFHFIPPDDRVFLQAPHRIVFEAAGISPQSPAGA